MVRSRCNRFTTTVSITFQAGSNRSFLEPELNCLGDSEVTQKRENANGYGRNRTSRKINVSKQFVWRTIRLRPLTEIKTCVSLYRFLNLFFWLGCAFANGTLVLEILLQLFEVPEQNWTGWNIDTNAFVENPPQLSRVMICISFTMPCLVHCAN